LDFGVRQRSKIAHWIRHVFKQLQVISELETLS